MSIDLDQYLHLFFEEGFENLAALRESLAACESAGSLAEDLERAVRAVHSLKGACGPFGFDDIQMLSQGVEDLLRAALRGQLVLGAEHYRQCRIACDVLAQTLQQHQQHQCGDPAILARQVQVLRVFLAPTGPVALQGAPR